MHMFKHKYTCTGMCVSVDMTRVRHQGTTLSVGPWLPPRLRQCLFVVHWWIYQANWLRSFQRFCFCLLSFCRRTGIIDACYLYGTYMDLYGSSGSELGSLHLCCKHFTRRFISILFFETFAHSLGWLWIPYLPVSASWVLEILACDTMLCLCGAKDQTKGFVHTR